MRLIILDVVIFVLYFAMRGVCICRLFPPKGQFMTQLYGALRQAISYTGRSVIGCK